MKIVHEQGYRENKGDRENQGEVPVVRQVGVKRCRQAIYEDQADTKERGDQTEPDIFIRKIKYVCVKKVK